MKNVICIPARMESTRFWGKPMADARGKPLIAWAIDAARQSKLADAVWVVTDSAEITFWCSEYGVSRRFQPVFADNGTDRVAAFLTYDYLAGVPGINKIKKIVCLQCDEPEVTGDLLDSVFMAIDPEVDPNVEMRAATAVFPIPDGQAEDPHLVKAVVHDGFAYWFSRLPLPGAMGHVGVYGYSWQSIMRYHTGPKHLETLESLEQMRVIEMGGEIATIQTKPVRSINTPEDLARWNADVGTAARNAEPG